MIEGTVDGIPEASGIIPAGTSSPRNLRRRNRRNPKMTRKRPSRTGHPRPSTTTGAVENPPRRSSKNGQTIRTANRFGTPADNVDLFWILGK
jgi:hypothetical protein